MLKSEQMCFCFEMIVEAKRTSDARDVRCGSYDG